MIGAIGLLVVTALPGCGYALAGRGSFLPSYIRTVAIPTFVNRTAVTGVEELITRKVREEFIGRGRFTVVPDSEMANATLTGEIVAISSTPAGVTSQQLASRYLITTVIKATFTDNMTKEALWSDEALAFRDEYDLGPAGLNNEGFVDQQRGSSERLATDVARTIVTSIVEAF